MERIMNVQDVLLKAMAKSPGRTRRNKRWQSGMPPASSAKRLACSGGEPCPPRRSGLGEARRRKSGADRLPGSASRALIHWTYKRLFNALVGPRGKSFIEKLVYS